LHALHGLLHRLGHVQRYFEQPDQAPADAGQVEEVVHQAGHVPDLALGHRPHLLDQGGVVTAQADDLQCIADGGKGVAQLVGQHRQEIILLPGLLRQLLGPLVQGLLQMLPFGAVPQHLGEAPQPALLVPQGGGDAVAPQPCAALSHHPAVVVGPARVGGGLQLLVRLTRLHVFGSEKAGEMLSDNFGLCNAEDAFGPGVPGGDFPVRFEEEDGVVGDTLHQQAVLLFGTAEGGRRRLLTGRIARRGVRGTLVHGSSPSTVATCGASFSHHLRAAAAIWSPGVPEPHGLRRMRSKRRAGVSPQAPGEGSVG
jgi:hypothetical protein